MTIELIHIRPRDYIDVPSVRQVFELAGANILRLNDDRVKLGCLTAVVIGDDQKKVVEETVESIRMQASFMGICPPPMSIVS